ncbi:MAG: hypothetical protein AAF528_02130 [Cyanobacteria bacterium P01_C01_bin.121]
MHGVNKGSVSRRARELGYDTANGLSPKAYEVMRIEFNVGAQSDSEISDNPDQPTAYRAGGLVPVKQGTVSRTIGLFDAASYEADKAQLETSTRNQAASLNEMVAAYAQSRIASVLADIDLVADSVRANALQAMGTQPGKSQASPHDGNAA